MKKSNCLLILVTAIVLLALSCSKGSTGPAGAQGPVGAAGPVGPQGPQGNANVKTDTFTVPAASWGNLAAYMFETSSGAYTEYFIQTYARSNNTITQDVLDNGMVLVFFTPAPVNFPNQWEPLPYMFPSFGTQYYTNFVYITAPGKVTLGFFFSKIDPAATLPNISTFTMTMDYKFKIIAVTGEAVTSLARQHIDLKNYTEVSKALGLEEQDKIDGTITNP